MKKWEKRLRDAVSSRKPEKADVVVRDQEGREIFEVYLGKGSSVKTKA